MCDLDCIFFVADALRGNEIRGKRIIEVGSRNVNGSVRPYVESRAPLGYIGVDIAPGPGVDRICDAESLCRVFGPESFDIVICTEVLEHVMNWRTVVSNLKNLCRPGGIILVTTRSIGFEYHGHPWDFWRFQREDLENLFSDCSIEMLQESDQKGVFIKGRKPAPFMEKNTADIALYSVVSNMRVLKTGHFSVSRQRMLFFRTETRKAVRSMVSKSRKLFFLLKASLGGRSR